MSTMTRGERTELARVLRLRTRVLKADVDVRGAQILADVEAQFAAQYSASHEAWAEITADARRVVAAADAQIAARCSELGIPEEFRPSLYANWCSRGENADKHRRAELRKVAQTKIDARVKAAKLAIDRHEVALQTTLAADAMETSDAATFLAAIPGVEELLPSLTLEQCDVLRLVRRQE